MKKKKKYTYIYALWRAGRSSSDKVRFHYTLNVPYTTYTYPGYQLIQEIVN